MEVKHEEAKPSVEVVQPRVTRGEMASYWQDRLRWNSRKKFFLLRVVRLR